MYLEKYNLEGKTVVINGGARNIGFACAEAFSECGATVALTDINHIVKDSAEALKKYGKSCSGHIVDLTDSEQVEETAKEIITIHKNIDIVVNNAGIARCTPAEEISDTEWLEVMDINVNSMYWCCRSFGKIMLKQSGGSIVNVGSMSGIISNKPQQQVHYNASKAAVHMATKSLAGEWATKGIRVNASGCLNRCKKGPLMVIYPEGIWFKVTNKKDIDLIIEKYIKDNRLIKKLLVSN